MIVDSAIYGQGILVDNTAAEVGGVRDRLPSPGAFVWIGLLEPTAQEFDAVRREFDLHELAVEDAVKAHQRPKLEFYGDSIFLVLKTVMYNDLDEVVEIGEGMVFLGRDFLITVRHGEGGGFGDVRERLEERPDLLRFGPGAALYALSSSSPRRRFRTSALTAASTSATSPTTSRASSNNSTASATCSRASSRRT